MKPTRSRSEEELEEEEGATWPSGTARESDVSIPPSIATRTAYPQTDSDRTETSSSNGFDSQEFGVTLFELYTYVPSSSEDNDVSSVGAETEAENDFREPTDDAVIERVQGEGAAETPPIIVIHTVEETSVLGTDLHMRAEVTVTTVCKEEITEQRESQDGETDLIGPHQPFVESRSSTTSSVQLRQQQRRFAKVPVVSEYSNPKYAELDVDESVECGQERSSRGSRSSLQGAALDQELDLDMARRRIRGRTDENEDRSVRGGSASSQSIPSRREGDGVEGNRDGGRKQGEQEEDIWTRRLRRLQKLKNHTRQSKDVLYPPLPRDDEVEPVEDPSRNHHHQHQAEGNCHIPRAAPRQSSFVMVDTTSNQILTDPFISTSPPSPYTASATLPGPNPPPLPPSKSSTSYDPDGVMHLAEAVRLYGIHGTQATQPPRSYPTHPISTTFAPTGASGRASHSVVPSYERFVHGPVDGFAGRENTALEQDLRPRSVTERLWTTLWGRESFWERMQQQQRQQQQQLQQQQQQRQGEMELASRRPTLHLAPPPPTTPPSHIVPRVVSTPSTALSSTIMTATVSSVPSSPSSSPSSSSSSTASRQRTTISRPSLPRTDARGCKGFIMPFLSRMLCGCGGQDTHGFPLVHSNEPVQLTEQNLQNLENNDINHDASGQISAGTPTATPFTQVIQMPPSSSAIASGSHYSESVLTGPTAAPSVIHPDHGINSNSGYSNIMRNIDARNSIVHQHRLFSHERPLSFVPARTTSAGLESSRSRTAMEITTISVPGTAVANPSWLDTAISPLHHRNVEEPRYDSMGPGTALQLNQPCSLNSSTQH
ncbi:hypothetical protein BC939DRAFT_500445 [Gamsiella multidivaricata]|uniref:uncharacterized protein n=1 Tax=Gamsiella multidivaricata TaxID=101098 RepID=UPI00221FEC27|nr:uncharacterized protein BC939DRAFT_500445 [Gamsiella multidivaricata]KAI7829000.1 hypothetical protein BC939DRAFT_500445 [Gamsiella multidivaricata]